jgi:purine catabolism regulator
MWRAFDVAAVVESLAFRGATVAAGRGGTSRPVLRARLAWSPDDLRQVDAGELVVTTVPTLVASGEDADRLVARLDGARIAGVAVRADPDGTIPRAISRAADRLHLPVIAFPADTELGEVTTALLDALLAAQRRRLDHVLDIHQQFTRMELAGAGTAEIASVLLVVVGCSVAVVDADGRVSVTVPSDAEMRLDAGDDTAWIRQPIRAGDEDYGEVIACRNDEDTLGDAVVATERAAMAIAVRLAQADALAEEHARFAAVSLEELVAGRGAGVDDVVERAASFGWDLTIPRAVLLASVDPPEDGEVPQAALATIAAAARATLGPRTIVWTRTTTVAALLAPETDAPSDRRDTADALRRELDARVRSVTVSIGVGRRVDTPADLSRSFEEATRAVAVGRWAKGRHVTEIYDELGLERLLAATPQEDLAEFVRRAIGPLVRHDRVQRSDLVETLAMWLETRNMAEAARRLHVHYNTLKNRLERIETILGPVLSDSARALECEVAIYVDRHYDVPWDEAGATVETEQS